MRAAAAVSRRPPRKPRPLRKPPRRIGGGRALEARGVALIAWRPTRSEGLGERAQEAARRHGARLDPADEERLGMGPQGCQFVVNPSASPPPRRPWPPVTRLRRVGRPASSAVAPRVLPNVHARRAVLRVAGRRSACRASGDAECGTHVMLGGETPDVIWRHGASRGDSTEPRE